MVGSGGLELVVPMFGQRQTVESVLVHVAIVQIVELYVEFRVGNGRHRLTIRHRLIYGSKYVVLLVLVQVDHHPAGDGMHLARILVVEDFARLQLLLQLLCVLLLELFVDYELFAVFGGVGGRHGDRRRDGVRVEVVAVRAVSALGLRRLASIKYERFGRIVDEQIAADELQPVGLPLAEAGLAVVFDDAFALHGRLKLYDGRVQEHAVQQ